MPQQTFRQFLDGLGPGNRNKPLGTLRKAYNKSQANTTPSGPTAEQRAQLPTNLIGRESDVVGRFRGIPTNKIRLNPDDVRYQRNAFGTTFAVRRSDTDDLSREQRGIVGDFDRDTGLQGDRIQKSYAQLAADARSDRDAGAAALTNLGQATTAGLGSGVGSSGASSVEQNLGAELGRSAAEQSVANNTSTVSGLNRLPTVVGSEGATTLERFRAGRSTDRTSLISGIREQNAAQQAAEQEAAVKQQQIAATLRGQSIGLLGTQLGVEGRIATTQISTQQKERDRVTRAQTAAATLRNQAEIARANNDIKRANHLDNLAHNREVLAKDLRALKKKNAPKIGDGIKTARDLFFGEVNGVAGNVTEIYHELRTRGYNHAQANRVMKTAIGQNLLDDQGYVLNDEGELFTSGRSFKGVPDPAKPPSSVFGTGPFER